MRREGERVRKERGKSEVGGSSNCDVVIVLVIYIGMLRLRSDLTFFRSEMPD